MKKNNGSYQTVVEETEQSCYYIYNVLLKHREIFFVLLGSVVNFIMDNYLCNDSLFLQQAKLSLKNKGFENTTFNDILGTGIPSLIINIMYCHEFVNDNNSTVNFHVI